MIPFFQYSEVRAKLLERSVEYAFKTFEITLAGSIPYPRTSVSFYRSPSINIPIGGIISLSFGMYTQFCQICSLNSDPNYIVYI